MSLLTSTLAVVGILYIATSVINLMRSNRFTLIHSELIMVNRTSRFNRLVDYTVSVMLNQGKRKSKSIT